MNRFLKIAGCAGSFAIAAHAGVDNIVPRPVQVTPKQGEFVITRQTAIAADPSIAGGQRVAEQLAERLQPAMGYRLATTAKATSKAPAIHLTNNPQIRSEEGYLLRAGPGGVTIEARGAAGLFYGMQTLLQLLPADIFKTTAQPDVAWTVPAVEIMDAPRYTWRGLHLDCGRHYFPVEYVKKYIDLLALHKMNVLHWHLTEDQGWRIEIKKYPELTRVGSVRKESPKAGNRDVGDGTPYGPFFYTQDQIRDVVAYAAARHITVVPEIEMPGHALAALATYPELSCTGGPHEVGTKWGVFDDIFCAGNPAVYTFLEDVLTEVIQLFPSRFIHIGGDEAPKARWQKCPKCQAVIQSKGLKNEHELQSYFIRHFDQFLQSKGRRLIGWDEILEGGIDPSATVMAWRGVKEGIQAAQSGHDVVMTPNSACYLDYAQAQGPNEPEAIGGFLPLETVYSYEPTPSELTPDQRKHVLGVQGNLWAEYLSTPEKADYFAYPRACAIAEIGWSPAEGKDFKDFRRRLETHLLRLKNAGVHARPLDPAP